MFLPTAFLLSFLLHFTCQYPASPESQDGPLLLTPYIESNQVEEGRALAQVNSFQWKGLPWNVTSYSGLFTVDKKYGSNMFFWYFPSESNPSKVPVIVWLNGFSTASSYGIFLQNGPYDLNHASSLIPRKTSWQKYYHVIYIDNPVGVGFSYTESEDGYSKTLDQVMTNLHSTLEQFFKLFPELVSHDLYIAGLSLGGKYVSSLAYKIYEKQSFNLKGIFLGNPLLDAYYQIDAGDYLYQLGFIDKKQEKYINKQTEIQRKFLQMKQYQKPFQMEFGLALADKSFLLQATGLDNIYNYNDPYVTTKHYDQFINDDVVKKALHVNNLKFNTGEKAMSLAAGIYGQSVAPFLQKMVEKINMVFYVGQVDLVISYPLVVDVLSSLKWSGQAGYINEGRSKLYDDNGKLWGYIRSYKTLTDVLVRKAGHSAITDQPEGILRLLFNLTNYHQFTG